MGRFEGATVLITGAAGGLGRGAAKGFATEGARLVLSDIDEKALAGLADTLQAETAILAGNIADEKLSEDLVRLAVEKFGRLDVAINNAGIVQSFVRLPQVPSDEARRVLEVDLLGVFYAMKHQIPQMERQFKATGRGGAFDRRRAGQADDAVLGGGIDRKFRRARQAGGRCDVDDGEALAELTRGVPMKRVAEVDEITTAILFAADPANSFMTGHALAIDGGVGAI